MMKKLIKTIGVIAAIGTITVGSYLFGTTNSETVTEIQTIEKTVEVVPDGYMDTNSEEFQNNYIDMRKVTYFEANDGLQLYYADGTGYYLE